MYVDEIVPGRIFRLGGTVPLDGRVSWAPAEPGRFQPLNCYVIRDGARSYLIDTGVAAHREPILQGLQEVVPEGTNLTLFLTRTEFQVVGNVGAVHAVRPFSEMITLFKDISTFAAYGEVANEVANAVPRRELARDLTDNPFLGDSKTLELMSPQLRVLTTHWIYDHVSKVLFTSDSFGHTSLPSATSGVIAREFDEKVTTLQSATAHVVARQYWLPMGDVETLIASLRQIFAKYDVAGIAPGFGCVLMGRDLVRRHVDLLIEVLRTASRPAWAGKGMRP